MAFSLEQKTAQKIVDTVKDVCGYDINFINPNGIIFASTNPYRIGDYHQIGRQVIQKQETVEVESDDIFPGTQRGVNIPFIYKHESIAAIGITGAPSKVRQYAVLAQKITALILREQELGSMKFVEKNEVNYIVSSLITDSAIHPDYLSDFIKKHNLSINNEYRTIIVELNSKQNSSNISLLENYIYTTFDNVLNSIYTFDYPNKYILIVSEQSYKKCNYLFYSLANDYQGALQIGIGNPYTLTKQHNSYESAKIVIKGLSSKKNISTFEELDLEILLGCVTKEAKTRYLEKTISGLDSFDVTLLKAYFDAGMSLKETSAQLFLHKNTLQYKLNRIYKITGYNPREFKDAVVLYMALKM